MSSVGATDPGVTVPMRSRDPGHGAAAYSIAPATKASQPLISKPMGQIRSGRIAFRWSTRAAVDLAHGHNTLWSTCTVVHRSNPQSPHGSTLATTQLGPTATVPLAQRPLCFPKINPRSSNIQKYFNKCPGSCVLTPAFFPKMTLGPEIVFKLIFNYFESENSSKYSHFCS